MPALPSSNPAQFVQGAPVLHVQDVKGTATFYRDILGFEVVTDSGGGDSSSWILLRLNDVYLMLNDQYEPDSVPETPPDERTKWHSDTCLYFSCPDPEGAFEYLESRGIDIKPPSIAPYGMRQLYLDDPDGYSLCFQCHID